MVWYRVVGCGGWFKLPVYPYKTKEAAKARIREIEDRAGMSCGARIYGYRTRAQARAGGISDNIGQFGRVE